MDKELIRLRSEFDQIYFTFLSDMRELVQNPEIEISKLINLLSDEAIQYKFNCPSSRLMSIKEARNMWAHYSDDQREQMKIGIEQIKLILKGLKRSDALANVEMIHRGRVDYDIRLQPIPTVDNPPKVREEVVPKKTVSKMKPPKTEGTSGAAKGNRVIEEFLKENPDSINRSPGMIWNLIGEQYAKDSGLGKPREGFNIEWSKWKKHFNK